MKNDFKKYSARQFLPIENIIDGIIKLKDGTYIKILRVEPININLKTNFEKEALLNNYKNFLFSLNFDIQIIIQSKKINIEEHLSNIKICNNNSSNLNSIINSYKNYLIQTTNQKTTSKNFYIVISHKTDLLKENITLNEIKQKLSKKYERIKSNLMRCENIVTDCTLKEDDIFSILYTFLNNRLSMIRGDENKFN